MTEDQTNNSMRRPFTSFCFVRFLKSFYFVPEFCLFVPWQGSRRSSSCSSPRQVGVGVRRDRRECRESTDREPSCPPIAGDIRRRRWLSQARRLVAWFPSCRSPRRAVRGRSRHRIGADQCPLASPLSQSPPLPQCPPARRCLNARRIAADSSPPDRR